MHGPQTRFRKRMLIDPAACGVRLGVELRAAAEQEADSAGICLSHWIRQLVEHAVKASKPLQETKAEPAIQQVRFQPKDALQSALTAAYAEKMEELKP
jgi:hypothetical protein